MAVGRKKQVSRAWRKIVTSFSMHWALAAETSCSFFFVQCKFWKCVMQLKISRVVKCVQWLDFFNQNTTKKQFKVTVNFGRWANTSQWMKAEGGNNAVFFFKKKGLTNVDVKNGIADKAFRLTNWCRKSMKDTWKDLAPNAAWNRRQVWMSCWTMRRQISIWMEFMNWCAIAASVSN